MLKHLPFQLIFSTLVLGDSQLIDGLLGCLRMFLIILRNCLLGGIRSGVCALVWESHKSCRNPPPPWSLEQFCLEQLLGAILNPEASGEWSLLALGVQIAAPKLILGFSVIWGPASWCRNREKESRRHLPCLAFFFLVPAGRKGREGEKRQPIPAGLS